MDITIGHSVFVVVQDYQNKISLMEDNQNNKNNILRARVSRDDAEHL